MTGHLSAPTPALKAGQKIRNAAFSLVELLVATAVSMLMMALLLTVFSGSLEAWTTTASRSETFGEARAALHLMERELNNAAPKIASAGVTVPTVITGLEAPGGGTDEALGFFCKVPHQGQPLAEAHSDICAVTYFLAPVSGQVNAPQALFRRLIPSGETFVRLGKTPAAFFEDACKVDALAEVVAQNVIAFNVRERDKDLKPIPPPTGGADASAIDEASPDAPSAAVYVEVTLKVISTRGAQTYFDPAVSAAQREQVVLQEAREFTLRHPLR
jgi:type II secretory pathway pseudopilin PulG